MQITDLEAATESVQKGESLKQMHGVYKQYAAEHHACYTCDRAFEDDSAVKTFIAKQVRPQTSHACFHSWTISHIPCQIKLISTNRSSRAPPQVTMCIGQGDCPGV